MGGNYPTCFVDLLCHWPIRLCHKRFDHWAIWWAILFANAKGNVITPFANGGIVNSPVLFPMRGGTGLMGEAGPEAIMPLSRGSDGKLGVRMGGGGSASVTVNISTPDAQSFRQSQSQVAAMVARAVERGQRNS